MKTKMKRSDELIAEISAIDERIGELRPQLDEHTKQLAIANEKFVKNEISLEALLTPKNAHAIISETIDTLLDRRGVLASELDSVLSIEAHATEIGTFQALTIQRGTAFDKYAQLRQAMNDTTTDLIEAKKEFERIQFEAQEIFRKLVPDFKFDVKWPFVPKQQRREVDTILDALDQAGVTREDVDRTLSDLGFPSLENEPVIKAAENHHLQAMHIARMEERSNRADAVNVRLAEEKAEWTKRRDAELSRLAVVQQRGLRVLER